MIRCKRKGNSMKKIIIVDDVKILRECLRMAVNKFFDYDVVGCAANGKEAIQMCKDKNPDVVLMDLNMPVCSGHEAIVEIKKNNKKTKILVLSAEGDEQNITEAFKNGADGYILKDIGPSELEIVLKKTIRGESFVQDNAFSMNHTVEEGEEDANTIHLYLKLEFTEMEKQVLDLVVEGMTNEEIGRKLEISFGKASKIVGDLISKCRVRNRTQLAVIAAKLGKCKE